jgi:hypothetical protein
MDEVIDLLAILDDPSSEPIWSDRMDSEPPGRIGHWEQRDRAETGAPGQAPYFGTWRRLIQ